MIQSTGKLLRSRTEAVFTWPWITVVSCLIVGRGLPPLRLTLMAFLSVFFTAASTYIYNDYIDTEMDQLNNVKKNRNNVFLGEKFPIGRRKAFSADHNRSWDGAGVTGF